MADKDDGLVTIHLDAQRQYRDPETWQVTTIGPGNVKVSAATAKKWKIAPVESHKAEAKAKAPTAAAPPTEDAKPA